MKIDITSEEKELLISLLYGYKNQTWDMLNTANDGNDTVNTKWVEMLEHNNAIADGIINKLD